MENRNSKNGSAAAVIDTSSTGDDATPTSKKAGSQATYPWMRTVSIHAPELANISAVVLVSLIGFGVLTVVTGSAFWLVDPWLLNGLAGVFFLSALFLFLFSFLAVRHEERMRADRVFVISEGTLRTLRANGLPDDLGDTLEEILAKARTSRDKRTELSVPHLQDRSAGSWVLQLESKLGHARLEECQKVLQKYTVRQRIHNARE